MKIGKIKNDKRIESRNDKSLGIQTFGDKNDYPQQVRRIVEASCTGKSCVKTYSKFIFGKGFCDKDFSNFIINRQGQTADYLLSQTSKDLAQFDGFVIHINYNANYKAVEFYHVPFEHARFEQMNENGNFNKIAIHTDWGRQFTNLKKFKKEDIEFIDIFNPDPSVIKKQVDEAGSWHNYRGQVYYYSNAGENTYPLPIFDAVLTDMSTEEGISNVSYRNARNNFFTNGMLVDILNKDESDEQENETEESLINFQGDEEACKIMYISVDSEEEVPKFVPFETKNYDKSFEVTRKAVKDSIGEAFNQPPVLRAQDVGSNFGANLIENAYNYYNSVTENERLILERTFTRLFSLWSHELSETFKIEPLTFIVKITLAERLGEKGLEQVMKILESSHSNKAGLLRRLYDLEDDEIQDLL